MNTSPQVTPDMFIFGGVMLLIWLVFFAITITLSILIWWKICSKAGYPGALGLLMLVPIANLVLLLMLAFGDWPVLQELRHLRRT